MDTLQVTFMYGININKSINISTKIIDFLDKNNIITINTNIHHIIGKDPYEGQKKKLFILKNNKVIRIIDEYSEYLMTSIDKDYILSINNYNTEKHKQYIVINNNLIGGSHQWFVELSKYIPCCRVSRYNELCSVINQIDKTVAIYVIINSFIGTNFTIDIILKLYDIFKFKIILPFHEWYWFKLKQKETYNCHSIYLNNNLIIHKNVRKLFEISHSIICPSLFVYKHLSKIYHHNKIVTLPWIDYNLISKKHLINVPKNKNCINIGILVNNSTYKGKNNVFFLMNHYKNNKNINFFIVGFNIPRYKNNYHSYLTTIIKYKIHGLIFLNIWGETWCYGLTKALLSNLPIFYNNIGCFKTRIPKDKEKYIINAIDEKECLDTKLLLHNFKRFINYIKNNDIFVNIKETKKETKQFLKIFNEI